MTYEVRLGRAEDHEGIAAFTTDTFEWGDYVADSFLGWLDAPDVEVLVAIHASDGPVAVATLRQPGPRQAWMAAARVRPDHRRKGLADRLNDAGVALARRRGDRVSRLAIEDWNEAPQRQVERLGYRPTSRWWFVREPVESVERLPARERLEPTPPSPEIWATWQRSAYASGGRGLVGLHWTWWTLTPDDLAGFASDGLLFGCPAGWALVEPLEDRLAVSWMCSADADFSRLADAARDLAREHDLPQVSFNVPDEARLLQSVGDERSSVTVWELPLLD